MYRAGDQTFHIEGFPIVYMNDHLIIFKRPGTKDICKISRNYIDWKIHFNEEEKERIKKQIVLGHYSEGYYLDVNVYDAKQFCKELNSRLLKGYKIGFSEVADGKDLAFALITLEIPEDYPGRTLIGFPFGGYRSNVARVLSIRRIDQYRTFGKSSFTVTLSSDKLDSAFSIYDKNFFYRPGEIVFPDKFDTNYHKICTNGIHFYLCESSAINYVLDDWVQTKYRMCLPWLRRGVLRS